jgi:hypothetical protein
LASLANAHPPTSLPPTSSFSQQFINLSSVPVLERASEHKTHPDWKGEEEISFCAMGNEEEIFSIYSSGNAEKIEQENVCNFSLESKLGDFLSPSTNSRTSGAAPKGRAKFYDIISTCQHHVSKIVVAKDQKRNKSFS